MMLSGVVDDERQGRLAPLIGDGLWVAAGQALAIIGALALSVSAVRTLGSEGFASLAWLLSCLAYLGALARLGTMQAAARVLSGRYDDQRARLVGLLIGPLAASMVVAVLWWLVLGPAVVAGTVQPDRYRPIVGLVSLWLPLAVLGPTVSAVLRALGRFPPSLLTGEWARRFVLALVFAAGAPVGQPALAADDRWSELIARAVVAAIVAEVAALVVAVTLAFRATPLAGDRPVDLGVVRRSLPFYLGSIVTLLVPQSGVWLLAFVAEPSAVAEFGVAVRLSLLFTLPVFIGSSVMVPRIAHAAHEGTLSALEPVLRRFATMATALVLCGLIGFVAVGRPVISVLFGHELVASHLLTIVLAVGVVATAGTGLCGALLANSGHAWMVSTAATIAGTLFVGLGLIGGHVAGALGMAVVAAAVQVGQNAAMVVLAARRTGLQTGASLQTARSVARAASLSAVRSAIRSAVRSGGAGTG
jgi:O-antigen/teichoic acid export membrane protein